MSAGEVFSLKERWRPCLALSILFSFLGFLLPIVAYASSPTSTPVEVHVLDVFIGVLACLAVIFAHEALHALGFLLVGVKPGFHVKRVGLLPVFCVDSSGRAVPPLKFVLVSVLPVATSTPLLVILTFFLPKLVFYTSMACAQSLGGSAGDLMFTFVALKRMRPVVDKGVLIKILAG